MVESFFFRIVIVSNVCLQMAKYEELTKSVNTILLSLQPCLFHYSPSIYPFKPNEITATGCENIVQERKQICLKLNAFLPTKGKSCHGIFYYYFELKEKNEQQEVRLFCLFNLLNYTIVGTDLR